MKNYLAILIIISIIFVSGCTIDTEKLIGGQRDEHGCLGPAGYSFNETFGICVREWEVKELDENQLKALELAAQYLATRRDIYSLTYLEIKPQECDGCFDIAFSTERFKRIEIKIEDWKVKSETLVN